MSQLRISATVPPLHVALENWRTAVHDERRAAEQVASVKDALRDAQKVLGGAERQRIRCEEELAAAKEKHDGQS